MRTRQKKKVAPPVDVLSLRTGSKEPTLNEPIRFGLGKANEVIEERYIVNVTKGRSSRWHNTGPWPSTAYHLKPKRKTDRFCDRGDVVENVVLERRLYQYASCLPVTVEKVRVVDRFTL